MRDVAIIVRAQAALEVIRSDPRADPELMLSLVIWPPEGAEGIAAPRRRAVTWEECERIFTLAGEGLTHRAIGTRVGRSRTTVTELLRCDAAGLSVRFGKAPEVAAIMVGLAVLGAIGETPQGSSHEPSTVGPIG